MKDCVSCVHEYLSPMSDTCRECGIAMLNYKEAKPKPTTNYDLLRAKSVEEMAEWLGDKDTCPPGACTHMYDGVDCPECWLDWLKQEVVSDG